VAAKRSRHVRRFLNAAHLRRQDAGFLRDAGRTLAAAYLAGYAVEFVLKALLLGQCPEHEQPAVMARFRGAWAHDHRQLLAEYRRRGGAAPSKQATDALVVLESWGTELRYDPRAEFPGDVGTFLAAVETVDQWARQRL
jgi:hypothetical protein